MNEIFRLMVSKVYISSHVKVVLADFCNKYSRFDEEEGIDHLQTTMDWLAYAMEVNRDGGVSAGYHFRRGWLPSYPETTGYLIPTFINYYYLTRREKYLDFAKKMGDWLISIQMSNGAFQGGFVGEAPEPRVFNTGQVLQGLVKIYEETKLEKYLESGIKAGKWLISIQDKDGAWKTFTYNGIEHVYKTRVAWALLELYKATFDEEYSHAVCRNISWALRNQERNGWFRMNAFDTKSNPFLHTIAYAIEGLLECGSMTGNKEWVASAVKPAEALLNVLKQTGTLSGAYDNKWQKTEKYRCLAGEAQMCVCWFRLFQLTGDYRWRDAALKVSSDLKRLQDTGSTNKGVRGGVKGSHPIWGGYEPFSYPNWAAKFFADALILEYKLMLGLSAQRNS